MSKRMRIIQKCALLAALTGTTLFSGCLGGGLWNQVGVGFGRTLGGIPANIVGGFLTNLLGL